MYFKTLSISRYLQSVSFKATRLELKYYIILWPHDSDLGTIYTVLFYKLRISLTSFKFSGCCLFFVFCFFFCFFFFILQEHVENTKAKKSSEVRNGRTYNIMIKRKWQYIVHKTLHRILNWNGKQFMIHQWNRLYFCQTIWTSSDMIYVNKYKHELPTKHIYV